MGFNGPRQLERVPEALRITSHDPPDPQHAQLSRFPFLGGLDDFQLLHLRDQELECFKPSKSHPYFHQAQGNQRQNPPQNQTCQNQTCQNQTRNPAKTTSKKTKTPLIEEGR